MTKLIQKIKHLFHGIRSGSVLSSSSPEPDFNPPVQPVRSSVEVDERTPGPDGDGWIKLPNGDRYRRLKIGPATGSEVTEDTPKVRGGSITRNNPGRDYRP